MDQIVKQCIDGRKDAFKLSYEINDKALEKRIDDLFKKIYELGEKCKDSMDFETQFASSPLNKEYTDLFTEIAEKCRPIIHNSEPDHHVKSDKEQMKDEIKSDAKYLVKDLTMPARRAAREEFDKKMRDTPLGKVEQLNNTAWVFKRIFKK